MPHCISRLKTISRWSTSELATTSAPLVEKGLQSTTELEIASAAIRPTALTWSVSRKGTASGISAPMMPVVEAKAETTEPMKQISRAATSGAPTEATPSPSQVTTPWFSSSVT